MKTHTAVQEQMHKALKMAFHYGRSTGSKPIASLIRLTRKLAKLTQSFETVCDETLQTLADVEGAQK